MVIEVRGDLAELGFEGADLHAEVASVAIPVGRLLRRGELRLWDWCHCCCCWRVTVPCGMRGVRDVLPAVRGVGE